MEPLLSVEDGLVTGIIEDRANRFVVRVHFGDTPERLFLGDPGALKGILEPGREVPCAPVDDPARATDYGAIAVRVDDVYVAGTDSTRQASSSTPRRDTSRCRRCEERTPHSFAGHDAGPDSSVPDVPIWECDGCGTPRHGPRLETDG